MLPHPDRLETQLFSEASVGRQILAAPLPQKSPKFHFSPTSNGLTSQARNGTFAFNLFPVNSACVRSGSSAPSTLARNSVNLRQRTSSIKLNQRRMGE